MRRVGALVSQLAPTRRLALELGCARAWRLFFLLRVLADTVDGARLAALAHAAGLGRGAAPVHRRAAAGARSCRSSARPADLGRGAASPRAATSAPASCRRVTAPRLAYALLSSPTAHALREAGAAACSPGPAAARSSRYILGIVSKSVSPADISQTCSTRSRSSAPARSSRRPATWRSCSLLSSLASASSPAPRSGGARHEEADGRLETLLALPVGRRALARRAARARASALLGRDRRSRPASRLGGRGLGGRRHLAVAGCSRRRANCLPVALLFLGLAALAYARRCRGRASASATALVAVSFLWQLVGSLLGAPDWLLDATPFAHVALVPQQPFDPVSATALAAVGIAAGLLALVAFRRRDLAG